MGYINRGVYFEDIFIDKEIYTARRTVLDADVTNFAGISGDYNPLHIDDEYAKINIFGKRIAHGALGIAIMTGQVNQLGIFEGTTIALLEMTNKFKNPIIIGSTVHTVIVPRKKSLTKNSSKGIVEFDVLLKSHEGKTLIEANWVLMMACRNK